jgi:hypothetical protein
MGIAAEPPSINSAHSAPSARWPYPNGAARGRPGPFDSEDPTRYGATRIPTSPFVNGDHGAMAVGQSATGYGLAASMPPTRLPDHLRGVLAHPIESFESQGLCLDTQHRSARESSASARESELSTRTMFTRWWARATLGPFDADCPFGTTSPPANPDVIGRTPAVDRHRMFAMNQITELSSLL